MAYIAAGARLVELPLSELAEIGQINAPGGLSPVEAWATHREDMRTRRERFDPRALVDTLDVPAATSAHAGTFLCNAALYYALGRASRARVAFVHVPDRKRRLAAEDAARGLRQVVDFLRPR